MSSAHTPSPLRADTAKPPQVHKMFHLGEGDSVDIFIDIFAHPWTLPSMCRSVPPSRRTGTVSVVMTLARYGATSGRQSR